MSKQSIKHQIRMAHFAYAWLNEGFDIPFLGTTMIQRVQWFKSWIHFTYMPILSQWQCSADEVYYQHVMTRDTFVPKPFSSQMLDPHFCNFCNTDRNFTFTSTLWDANKQGVVRYFCEEWIGLKYSPVLVVGILSSWLDQCHSCHPPLLLLLPPLAWVQLSPWQPRTQNLLKRVQNFPDQLCFLGSSPSNANALAQLQLLLLVASAGLEEAELDSLTLLLLLQGNLD